MRAILRWLRALFIDPTPPKLCPNCKLKPLARPTDKVCTKCWWEVREA